MVQQYILSEEHDINTELLKQYQTLEAKLEEDHQQLSKRHETEVQRTWSYVNNLFSATRKKRSQKEEKKGLLDSGITIEEVKIPGLDI